MILHGFLCSSKFFYKNIDALSADHRLVLIDWRGARFFVKNASKSHYGPLCKDVHELIEYLGLEDVTLLGWSMGSSVVMEYYEQFGDEHLKKIGVIDLPCTLFSPESWNSHSLAGFNMDAMTATLENALSHHDDYARTFTRLCFHTPPCQEDEDWVSTK